MAPAILLVVPYRDVRHGQPRGAKLPQQRNLILPDGGCGREPTTATPSIQGVGNQGGVARSTQVKRRVTVVTINERKMLTRSDQTVGGRVQGLIILLAQTENHRRRDAAFSTHWYIDGTW